MHRPTLFQATLPALFAAGVLSACSSSTTPSDMLTVRGANVLPPAAIRITPAVTAFGGSTPDGTGDPANLLIGVYALYISANTDCSAPIPVQDYGATAAVKDFVANPVLFTGSPAAGAYQCVVVKMSDVIHVVPDSSFGNCVIGTDYAGDIYREGDSTWKDVDLNPIIGTGTDSVPADDRVAIVMTRDTVAAIARGFSGNQVIPLGSDLIVPGQSTFIWNGQGTVVDEGGQCGVNPGSPEFR